MKLDAKARRTLPSTAFALPGRRFPIHDLKHAKAALMMRGHVSPAEQAEIQRKVYARYPELRPGGEKTADLHQSGTPSNTPLRDAVKVAPFAGALAGMVLRRGTKKLPRHLLEGAAEGAGFGYLPSAAMDAHDIIVRRRAGAAQRPLIKKAAPSDYTDFERNAVLGGSGGMAASVVLDWRSLTRDAPQHRLSNPLRLAALGLLGGGMASRHYRLKKKQK